MIFFPILVSTDTNRCITDRHTYRLAFQRVFIIKGVQHLFVICEASKNGFTLFLPILFMTYLFLESKSRKALYLIYSFLQAVSDLLLGVFCMPFTLVGQMLRNFIFGRIMCKIIPYFQGKFFTRNYI